MRAKVTTGLKIPLFFAAAVTLHGKNGLDGDTSLLIDQMEQKFPKFLTWLNHFTKECVPLKSLEMCSIWSEGLQKFNEQVFQLIPAKNIDCDWELYILEPFTRWPNPAKPKTPAERSVLINRKCSQLLQNWKSDYRLQDLSLFFAVAMTLKETDALNTYIALPVNSPQVSEVDG
eukprot:Gregarina_sp_Poly_1__5006@NODE_2653_length_1870_cov_8_973378_g1683_i0_p1_GENE_NODE_2653_length_1870_cov_8_973378_g1683_i0NODE_2653_length_1870_cov_8_973378_g1683_i0_p1_ORF_typecomplete_len174_score22_55DUF3433/PF11915_8/0_22DUF3557/PF12078_8/0_18_NODE_2653_length_1870_cov_8_973378_g1683_i011851706